LPASVDTAGSQRVHKVTHVQSLANILGTIKFTSWIERMGTFVYHFGCQWNIASDNQVTRVGSLGYFVISNIKTLGYLYQRYPFNTRNWHRVIGNQSHRDTCALGGFEKNFFYDARAGIGIDPNLYGVFQFDLRVRLF